MAAATGKVRLERRARTVSDPRVTVLIGCWNNATTLPRAIESILDQTMEDLELIVVDDGSTDETPVVVDRYRDPRLRRLALEHIGIARSLNRGMQVANSSAIAFQDADDWSYPERLERQLVVLDERPEVAVVGCWMDEVDESGRPLAPRQPRRGGSIGNLLPRFCPIPGTCALIRRAAALEAGDFDPRFRFSQDYDLWSRIADRHEIVCLDEVLAVREMSSNAAGSRHERTQLREGLQIRFELMRRRRDPWAARHLLRPTLSLLAPVRLKAASRRWRGRAPGS
jgi:glycosyltransferase involved in cell wall biosynthesis